MKPSFLLAIFISILLFESNASAQDKLNIKFGKISPNDFELPKTGYDSSAEAVVIADMGYASFEGNEKSNFSIVFTHFRRAKIISKKGIDIATVEIPLYSEGNYQEKLTSLKATTYNLENGKVVSTKLDDKSLFTDKVERHFILKKFTFPAVKEGSIIEFTYTTTSDFYFNLQSWDFQGNYPVLWSEYETVVPEYFRYVTLSQGYQEFSIHKENSYAARYNVRAQLQDDLGSTGRTEMISLDATATDSRWVIKNVPALKEEKFTTTLNNHIQKIEFQLASIQYPNQPPTIVMNNWGKASEELIEDEQFGAEIHRGNGWMDEDIKSVTKGLTSNTEKAKKIFEFVRDNFVCSSHNNLYLTKGNSLKTIFKNKTGNVAEINLLLTSMLIHAGITADPVILSTRSHGVTNPFYPLMDRFNYVVCEANVDGQNYYLDASSKINSFYHLPGYCYNGHARVINKENPRAVYFEADSLMEQRMSTIFMVNDEKVNGKMVGSYQSIPGYYESYSMRNELDKDAIQTLKKELKSSTGTEMDIENLGLDSFYKPEFPITIHYDFSIHTDTSADLIYFTPLSIDPQFMRENPFKSADRKYPVERPYKTNNVIVLNMEIPKGYEVDELPKSARVAFNESDGLFEYLIAKDDNNVQLRCHIQINRANFSRDDYNSLRDFFAYIVKKEGEQIVFKKKK